MRPPFENTKPTDSEVDPFLQTKPTDPFGATVPTDISEQRVEQKINTMPAEQPESLVDQQGIFDRIAFTGSLSKDLTRLPHLAYDMLGATKRGLSAYWMWLADRRAGKQMIPLTSALSNALTNRKNAPYSNVKIQVGIGSLLFGANIYPYMEKEFAEKYPILHTELDILANVGSDIALSGYIMQSVKILSPLSRAGKMLNEPTRVTAELTQTRKGEIVPKFKVIRDKYPMKTFESMAMDQRNLDAKEEQARKTAELYTRVAKLNKDKQNIDINLGMADAIREQKRGLTGEELKQPSQQLRTINQVVRGAKQELFTDINKFSQELADTHKEVMDSLLIRERILVDMQDTVKLDPFSKQHYDQVLKTALSEIEKTKGVDIEQTIRRLGGGYKKTTKGKLAPFGTPEEEIQAVLDGRKLLVGTSDESIIDAVNRNSNKLKLFTGKTYKHRGADVTQYFAYDINREPEALNRIKRIEELNNVPHGIKRDTELGKLYDYSDDDIQYYINQNFANKGISTLPSADTQLRAINDGIKLTEDLDEVLKTQIKRAVYIEDIKGMIKPKGKLEEARKELSKTVGYVIGKENELYKSVAREAKLTGKLNRKAVDNMAYRFSDGIVSSYDELPLEQLQSVHGWLKMSDTLPQDMNWVRQFVVTNVTPDWYTMEKLGIGQFSRGIDDALHMINRWKESFNKVGNQIIKGYKDTSPSRIKWGEQTDELASYLADNGNDISKVPKDLLDQFNGQQIGYVQDSVAKIKEMTDTAAEMAIKLGYMTRDTETYNRLLETLKTTDEQILALQKSMKGLNTKGQERMAMRTQLSDLRKARKEVKDNIDKYPAIYNPSYYPHKKSLLNNIEQDIRSMEAENAQKVKRGKEVRKAREWSGDVGDFYSKQAFRKNMPLNINPSELMKRTANEDIFSRRFFDVTSTAFTSEMRKIFLEPEIKKGHAFIDAMPRNVTSDVMANTFDRMVRKARGMEMTGDVWANKLFYGMSKGVEKISGGRWHSRERAWEHFTDTIRKLTYGGTILGNTVVMTKNFFQVLHTVETLMPTATYAGWESMFTSGGRRILQSMPVMDGRFPMEALDITKKDVWDEINRIGGYGNAFIERYINCSAAGNGAIWKIMTSNQSKMDQLAKFAYSRGYDPKSMGGFRFWDAMADAMEAGLFQDVKDAASMNIKFTQWSYHKHDMSPVLSSSNGKLFFMFQNWTQHYATVFLPQLWRTLSTGESPITDAMGRKYTLTDPERYALLSHISLMVGIAVLGSQLGFNMDWITPVGQIPSGKIGGQTVPFPVSPPVSTAVDVGLLAVESMRGNDEGVKRALNSLQNYDLPTFIPAGSQARKMQRVIGGEVPPESLILPVEKQQQTGRITTRPSIQRGGQRIYSR